LRLCRADKCRWYGEEKRREEDRSRREREKREESRDQRREEKRREEEINPLANIVIGKKNASIRSDRSDRIEQRSSHPIYLSSLIFNSWQQYCCHSGEPHCELVEAALLEYMRNHPTSQVRIDITQDLKAALPDMQTRLRNKVLRDKIEGTLTIMRRLMERKDNPEEYRAQLQKLVLQATRLKHLDADLLRVLEQAEELL